MVSSNKVMRTVKIEPTYESWRNEARNLLANMIDPREILWQVQKADDQCEELFDFEGEVMANSNKHTSTFKISRQFVQLAKTVSSHRSDKQWGILYEVLWAMTYGNARSLLQKSTDPRVRVLEKLRAMVSRDIHKMRAFVRFREIISEEDGIECERYVAWFEPDHRILRLNSSFFRKRFGGMHFSILTPDECMHWNGSVVKFTKGVSKDNAPEEDELEDLWRGYYRSIFNPARLKIKMMQTEMPKKYWKNLPEAEIIEELIRDSSEQVRYMMEEKNRELKPRPKNKYLDELDQLNKKDIED